MASTDPLLNMLQFTGVSGCMDGIDSIDEVLAKSSE
jgi:hypothetical protein